jgi:outer membrane protein OmpA-like peptidoglycan-associated protein
LYAQWRHTKVATLPAVSWSATIGPFMHKASGLTTSLESEVSAIAAKVKAGHDNKIILVGYGDALSKTDSLNEALWAANYALSQERANAVKNYLVAEVAALGVKDFSISAMGNGSQVSGTSTTSPGKYGIVIASLT